MQDDKRQKGRYEPDKPMKYATNKDLKHLKPKYKIQSEDVLLFLILVLMATVR